MDDSLKSDFLNDLLIVLVIYKMKINDSPSYQSLTTALSRQKKSASLFIYDNSPHPQRFTADSCWDVDYCHDAANAGVSKGYNQGFKKAKELNKKWLLLADQDTIFPLDVFDKYAVAIARYPNQELFSPIVKSRSSVISPFRFVLGRGIPLSNADSGCYDLKNIKFINSGLLVSISLYFRCGGYDESFPLDFSDIVFSDRAQGFAEKLVVIEGTCDHSLSSNDNSFEESSIRFNHFVKASKTYGQLRGISFILFVSRLLRSIKLSYRFRSFAFLKIILK